MRITGTVLKDKYTFMIIFCSFLLRMRNDSERESQNTQFMFNNSPPKIMPFMR